MSTEFWDETFEEQQSREKREYFFGHYSAEIRKNLLSKNIPRPENIYDILYTKTREAMLAKNTPSVIVQDLDEKSSNIRNSMLSKHVENQINLDLTGENYRQSQISKNNLLQSSVSLEKLSNSFRDELVSKNVEKQIDLDNRAREIRNLNITQNVEKNINLDQNSNDIRNNMLSKNVEEPNSLDSQASLTRERMLSSNVKSSSNIDDNSSFIRNNSLSKNIDKSINIDKQSEDFRESQESKNIEKNINLDSLADSTRNSMLSFNKEKNIDIDSIAETVRKINESQNVDAVNNIDEVANVARHSMISSNIENKNNIDDVANNIRGQLESKNENNNINIDNVASGVRDNMLSFNKEDNINLDKISESVRNNMLLSNKEDSITLDGFADSTREKMLSSNKENSINLDQSSQSIRNSLLTANKDIDIDLDRNSQIPRNNLLSTNTPANIDLDANSVVPRNTLLASNVPTDINLDTDSIIPRNNLLASNVPTNIDLDNNSVIPRNTLLASNVATNIDLDTDSIIPRNNLLASNVPTNIDLDASAAIPRATLLNSNSPANIDLDQSSIGPRAQLLNSNTPNFIDLDQSALAPRANLLSANNPANINLEENASQIRNNLLSANVNTPNQIENIASVFRHDMLTKNDKANGLGTNIFLGGTSTFIGVSNLEIISATIRELMKLKNKIFDKTTDLQPIYGLSLSGSGLTSALITNAAQLYNLQKNAFMNIRYGDVNSGYNMLLSHNSQGFQQLMSFSQLSSKRDLETNTTPREVIQENKGLYIGTQGVSVSAILKPGKENEPIGTAASMMSNTVPGDAIAVDFNKQKRGVSHIINTIKNSTIAMAKNYDVQNSSSFIIGTNSDGTNKIAYSRYTVANPYQPNKDAGTLELRIKNYAIYNGNKTLIHTMSFPPYIKSFANSDTANWNKIDYLGRPEPIYTYSNSNREGSLSFYVLTDYSQSVDMGYDYEKKSKITEEFSSHFTDQLDKEDRKSDIDTEIVFKKSQIDELNQQIITARENDVSDIAILEERVKELKEDVTNLEKAKSKIKEDGFRVSGKKFSEFDVINGNIFKTLISNGNTVEDGNLVMQTEQTKERLSRMKKDLLFQPAFFSGDKVDFLNRMEFIAKLTRPARSSAARGFSFTYPPVCHIHLGDWFNHDVIINSVSYDYSDAPWTIDGNGGRIQPMYALVTLSFNIVGTYGAYKNQDVPLASDTGGFFQKKTKGTKTGFVE